MDSNDRLITVVKMTLSCQSEYGVPFTRTMLPVFCQQLSVSQEDVETMCLLDYPEFDQEPTPQQKANLVQYLIRIRHWVH